MNTNQSNFNNKLNRPPRSRRRNRPNKTNVLKQEVGINVAAKNKKQNWIQPEFRMQKFKWMADYGNITSSGTSYAGKMMYANNLYDPDPSLLTSAVAGYADNMDFYFYCLPVDLHTKCVVSNREAFPVKVALLFSIQQADLLFSSAQNIIDLAENPISTDWTQLSAVGGQDRATLSLRVNLGRANGNEFEYNGNAATYSCQPTSAPPFPMFVSLLVWATSNFTSAGVGVSWQNTWNTRLWSRRLILDSGPTVAKKKLQLQLTESRAELEEIKSQIKVFQTLEILSAENAEKYGLLQDSLLRKSELIDKLRIAIDDPYQLLDL
jgi:hypothetical protein